MSALILHLDWFDLAGWRSVFILEGLPAIALGIIVLFYLTDHPRQAHWLQSEEREWLTSKLDEERQELRKGGHLTRWVKKVVRRSCGDASQAEFISLVGFTWSC